MTASEADTFEGRFWVPGDRHRSYGRVDYDHEHGVRLHLVDTNLTQRTPSAPSGLGPIEVLHGETLGGAPLTVLGVYPTHWTIHGMGPTSGDTVDALAEQVLRGAHLQSADDVVATTAACGLLGLKEFLTGGQIDRGPLWPNADRHAPADTLAVRVCHGAELLLVASRQHSMSRDSEQSYISASAQWTFDPPRPLPVIERDYVRVLQDLVLFATRRQSYVLTLAAYMGADCRRKVDVIRQPYPRPREAPDVYALALNLAEHEAPADLISAWYSLRRRIGPVWRVFFAALDRPESLLEDRLLGLLAFAEGYQRALHDSRPLTRKQEKGAAKTINAALTDADVRRVYTTAISHANSQTQRQRLDFLTGRALEVLGEWWYVERELFADRLIHTRNWLVHWGKRGKHVVEDEAGMVELVRALIVVLYVNLLRDLGLSGEAAAEVVGSGWRLEGLPDPVAEVDGEA